MTGSIRVLALVLCVGTLAGCGARNAEIEDDGLTIHNPHDGIWQDRAEVPIRFELEQVFGADEEPFEAVLGGVSYPLADDAGNVYFFDRGAHRIVSFDPTGNLRWQAGREGQGPGEFQQPSGMVWDGAERLFVLNQSGRRLETYTLDGTHLGEVNLELDSLFFPNVTGFIEPDLFVLTAPIMGRLGTNIIVARLLDEPRIVARAVEDQSGDIADMGGVSAGPSVSMIGDRIAVGNLREYRIAVYDTTGTLVREIRRDMHDIVRPGVYSRNGGSSLTMFGGVRAPVKLSDGFQLATASWPTNVPDPDEVVRRRVESQERPEIINAHAVDLYDSKDRLLYTLTGEGSMPEIGYTAFVDGAGRLYTTLYEPFPQLRRYRVVIDE